MGDNFGIHRPNEVKQIKTNNSGTPSDEMGATTGQNNLSDFLMQLEEYTPTVCIIYMCLKCITCKFLAFFSWRRFQTQLQVTISTQLALMRVLIQECKFFSFMATQTIIITPKIFSSVRLISVAAQKFISDIANDALIHCKTRTSNANSSHASSKQQKDKSAKDRKFTMTMEDLQPALNDYGITVRKAHYFV